ncbi:hypothetical protein IMY05_017G0042700 [Salix suchowensis]|nr:hypothetical protein IMY05_017G0042700 [Salix suchowensis]
MLKTSGGRWWVVGGWWWWYDGRLKWGQGDLIVCLVLDPRLNEGVNFPAHGLSLCGFLKKLRVAFSRRRDLPILYQTMRNCDAKMQK